jgi:hypothetical protein
MDDKYKAQKKYAKANIKKLSCSYPSEFVEEFRDACNKLGIKQSEVIRKTMEAVIENAKKDQSR